MQVKEAWQTENTGSRVGGQEGTADTARGPTEGAPPPFVLGPLTAV